MVVEELAEVDQWRNLSTLSLNSYASVRTVVKSKICSSFKCLTQWCLKFSFVDRYDVLCCKINEQIKRGGFLK